MEPCQAYNRVIQRLAFDSDYDIALEFLKENFTTFLDNNNHICILAQRGLNDFIKVLIDNGIDVNLVDTQGMSLLIHAICGKQVETVKFLLENGADVNKVYTVNKISKTPIEIVDYDFLYHTEIMDPVVFDRKVILDKKEILKLLVEYGANIPENMSDTLKIILQEKEIRELKERMQKLENLLENTIEEFSLRPPMDGSNLYKQIEKGFYEDIKKI